MNTNMKTYVEFIMEIKNELVLRLIKDSTIRQYTCCIAEDMAYDAEHNTNLNEEEEKRIYDFHKRFCNSVKEYIGNNYTVEAYIMNEIDKKDILPSLERKTEFRLRMLDDILLEAIKTKNRDTTPKTIGNILDVSKLTKTEYLDLVCAVDFYEDTISDLKLELQEKTEELKLSNECLDSANSMVENYFKQLKVFKKQAS